jgi:hypothetical protein
MTTFRNISGKTSVPHIRPIALVFLFLARCHKEEPPPPLSPPDFPGYDPPSIEALVKAAVDKGPPSNLAKDPYVRPNRIEVPPLRPSSAGALPKDDAGRPTLGEMLGVRVTIDVNKSDPLTGMGRCLGLTSRCVEPPRTANARTLDACWMSVPQCSTKQPWHESPCCPVRCIELYEE